MEIEERKKLAAYLRWGDITRIAKAAKVDKSTIHLWLKGKIQKSTAQPFVVAFANKRKEQVEDSVNAQLSN